MQPVASGGRCWLGIEDKWLYEVDGWGELQRVGEEEVDSEETFDNPGENSGGWERVCNQDVLIVVEVKAHVSEFSKDDVEDGNTCHDNANKFVVPGLVLHDVT